MGRFFDSFALWYQVDVFTVYFLIWQLMFVLTQWEYEQLPLLSTTFYQGWLCLLVASQAFVVYDVVFRYLPPSFKFCFFLDIILHRHVSKEKKYFCFGIY